MKKIKVKYCPYNDTDHTTPQTFSNFIHNILSKYYAVEISEHPDYIFFHETSTDYLNYDCIRINYTGENISANFNLTDYALGFDYLSFGDRYYRLPIYLVAAFYQKEELELGKNIDLMVPPPFSKEDLAKKTDFCSFVYSNYRADNNRKNFFDKLNSYKKVNSGGGYLNNIGYKTENKLGFESKHKFSIAFENSSRAGYTTEKIVCSLMAKTIPIYWGNPEIDKEFNNKRFINCHDYDSFDKVIERIKEIDNNDELYLRIINEPVFAKDFSPKKILSGFENFLKNIFDQPVEKSSRRTINQIRAFELESNERLIYKYNKIKSSIIKFFAFIYKPLKKIEAIEKLKFKIRKGTNQQ